MEVPSFQHLKRLEKHCQEQQQHVDSGGILTSESSTISRHWACQKQRKELRKKIGIHSSGLPQHAFTIEEKASSDQTELTLREVIRFLEQLEKEPSGPAYLREELKDAQHQLKSLTEENEQLKRQLKMTEEDYRALIGIVERVKQNISLKDYAK